MTETLDNNPMPFSRFLRDKQKEYCHDIYRDYALMVELAGRYERDLLVELNLPHDWAGWRPRMRWQVWGWTSEHHTHCVMVAFHT